MSSNRITREDIIRLKLNKRRQVRRLIRIVLTLLVLIGGISVYVVHKVSSDESGQSGGEVTVGVNPDLGENSEEEIPDYSKIDNSEAPDSSEGNTTEEDLLETFVFEVPKTELGDIDGSVGENWVDAGLFERKNEPVDIKYFSDVVFVGDSRTEGLILYSGLPNLNGFCYKALGINKLDKDENIAVPGYTDKYTCYDAISMTKYDAYYLSFGVNELGWVDVDVYIEFYDKLIDHILTVNPDAIIYVQNILPVSKTKSEESDIYNIDRINEFNSKILAMCQARRDVVYLDVAAAVSDGEGYLPEEASYDGIHCDASYCKRIIQYIRYNTYTKNNN